MGRTGVVIIEDLGLRGLEGEQSRRVMKGLLLSGLKGTDLFEMERTATVTDLRARGNHEVLVIMYGTAYVTPEGIDALSGAVLRRRDLAAIVPVSNESRFSDQRSAPPFLYQTVSVFRWAAGEISGQFNDEVVETDGIDDFCLAVRKDLLDDIPPELTLTALPKFMNTGGLRLGVARSVYVHRYGDVYESVREDLLAWVPVEAQQVLDVGCAGGRFGETLKRRQDCVVTGIDLDASLLTNARKRLDRVIRGDIEKAIDRGILGSYDCIVCGDLIEHLYDPWKVVRGLKRHLKDGGLLVATTPNVNNWAILADMMRGRWDYVPFGILSGTHIRFFTKQTFVELFEDAGYEIREVQFQSVGVPPKGDEFIRLVMTDFPGVSEEEMRSSEILLVAGV